MLGDNRSWRTRVPTIVGWQWYTEPQLLHADTRVSWGRPVVDFALDQHSYHVRDNSSTPGPRDPTRGITVERVRELARQARCPMSVRAVANALPPSAKGGQRVGLYQRAHRLARTRSLSPCAVRRSRLNSLPTPREK